MHPHLRAATVLAVLLVALVAVNLWADRASPRTRVVGGPVTTLPLLALGLLAALSWADLGLAPSELRRGTGRVLAPVGLYWAVNGLGVLAAARAWRTDGERTSPSPGGSHHRPGPTTALTRAGE